MIIGFIHTLVAVIMSGCGDPPPAALLALPEKIIYYQLGDSRVPIHIQQFGADGKTVFLNLHANEHTSVEAALPLARQYGGLLIRIENDRKRVIRFRFRGGRYGFDPNRMFSDTGIRESLRELGAYDAAAEEEVRLFAQRILSLLPGEMEWLVALHNNTDGGFSANSYQTGGENERDAARVHRQPGEDPDDFVFTTSEKIFEASVKLGFNSILQDDEGARPDGSLSVYAGGKPWSYVNLETEHGKVGRYREMLEALLVNRE